MATRKFKKALISCLAWAIFLYLLISNWDALKSVQWSDFRETIKISGISAFLIRNAGYIFLFGLIILFPIVCFRHNRKAQTRKPQTNNEEWQEHDEFQQAVNRDCDPSYSSLGGNIHHRTPFDNDLEWKHLEP